MYMRITWLNKYNVFFIIIVGGNDITDHKQYVFQLCTRADKSVKTVV